MFTVSRARFRVESINRFTMSNTTQEQTPASTSPSGRAATTVVEGTMVAEMPAPPTPAAQPLNTGHKTESSSFLMGQDEGVLRDVLDELDRERSKRAELEQQVRTLQEDLHSQKIRNTTNVSTTLKDYNVLKTERDGYLEVIDALTRDRPAFSSHQRLPLHVVRLLEIIPWDPRARPHLFGQEFLYEWQIRGSDKSWQKELRYFPTFFKTLPIVVPQPGKTVGEAPTSSSPPKHCVLTNLDLSQIYNIDKGYPLPQDGGDWKWIGAWRIEQNSDTDDKGWSYSNEPQISKDDSSYYSDLRMPKKGAKNILKRRRKWSRSRVMIDYTQASQMTKQYLKLLAEKAELDVSVDKLSSQLVETKMSLTTLEAEHLDLKEDLTRKVASLEKEREEKNNILKLVEEGMDGLASSASKKDQVKELRSVVTQWVSNTVSKRQSIHDTSVHGEDTTISTEPSGSDGEDENNTNNNSKHGESNNNAKQQMFESLRGKGSDLLEKIKQKGGEELEKIKKKDHQLPWQRGIKEKTGGGKVAPIFEEEPTE